MTYEEMISILIADCGSTTTSVALIEPLGGVYGLVAQVEVMSTHGPPWRDMTLGITEAIQLVEQQSGRRLLSPARSSVKPRSNTGHGVDAFVVVTSAAPPLRVSLVGLMSQLSLKSAQRAVTSTYAVVDYQIGSDDDSQSRAIETRVRALQQARSDLILLVGGIEGGATSPVVDLAHMIAMALGIMKPGSRPYVIFAGNSQLRLDVADILRGLTDFKSVDNICPTPDEENLGPVQEDLNRLFVERKIVQLPGMNTLLTWSPNTVVPAVKSFEQTVRYIGQTYGVLTMGVNLGSAATSISVKRNDFQATTTCAQVGLGSNAPVLLEQVSWEDLRRWLPVEMAEHEVKNFVLNKGIFPQTVPQTYQDVWLELALMREALRLVLAQARPGWAQNEKRQTDWLDWDLIIASGRALTQIVDPALAALVLLDSIEPAGICRLVLDMQGMARVLGGLAAVQPEAGAQIIDQALQFAEMSPLLNLGMVVAPVGVSGFGKTALRLEVTYGDGRQVEMKMPFGTLEVIPLASNEEATLRIRPARQFSLDPRWDQPGKEVKAVITGGVLGIIIDARGRPISFSRSEAERQQQLHDWLAHMSPNKDAIEVAKPEVEVYGA